MSKKIGKWRGVAALVRDAVEHGLRAVERVQIETAKRPFTILEAIPPIATPTKIVHVVHDASVATVHVAIRAVNSVAHAGIDLALARVAADETAGAQATDAPPEPTTPREAPRQAREE